MKTRSCAFVDFLKRADVKKQLEKNLEGITKAGVTKIDVASISRLFNEFPTDFGYLQPLINVLPDAYRKGNLEAWIKISLLYALDDLFDEKGELKQEIFDVLGDAGLSINASNKYEFVTNFFRSYIINLLSPLALDELNLFVSSHTLEEEHPLQFYSRIVQQVLGSFSLAPQSIDIFRDNLSDTDNTAHYPSFLQKLIIPYDKRSVRFAKQTRVLSAEVLKALPHQHSLFTDEEQPSRKTSKEDEITREFIRSKEAIRINRNFVQLKADEVDAFLLANLCRNQAEVDLLKHNYEQGILSHFLNRIFKSIQNSIPNYRVVFGASSMVKNLYRNEKDQICLEVKISGIDIIDDDVDPEKVLQHIPGTFYYNLVFTPAGVKVDLVASSNKALMMFSEGALFEKNNLLIILDAIKDKKDEEVDAALNEFIAIIREAALKAQGIAHFQPLALAGLDELAAAPEEVKEDNAESSEEEPEEESASEKEEPVKEADPEPKVTEAAESDVLVEENDLPLTFVNQQPNIVNRNPHMSALAIGMGILTVLTVVAILLCVFVPPIGVFGTAIGGLGMVGLALGATGAAAPLAGVGLIAGITACLLSISVGISKFVNRVRHSNEPEVKQINKRGSFGEIGERLGAGKPSVDGLSVSQSPRVVDVTETAEESEESTKQDVRPAGTRLEI